ncbi:hypothetical protein ACIP6X_43690 [Streptomyces coeruleorubidus]|uniref:hypothetical protein n=1 Tax=Streptomyces coeruleorubidus TaxID=116188 RepID=UPI00380D02DD
MPAPVAPTTAPPQQPVPADTPLYDTQPRGVSAYLPAEVFITVLVIIVILIFGLRYGAPVATAGIKALLRLFQNTPPAP